MEKDSQQIEAAQKNPKRWILVIVTVVVTFAIVGFFLFSNRTVELSEHFGTVEKVTLGVETSLLPSSVWVAEYKNYFQEEGLEVTIKEFDSGKASLVAMLDPEEEIDISAAAPTPIMFNSFDHEDFYYFATFASSNKDIKLTANKDSGILTSEDLRGKKIGTTLGTTGQYVVDTLLIYRDIPHSEVEVINFAPSDLPDSLHNGAVDAIVIWEPHGDKADKLLGDTSIKIPIEDVYTTTFNFLVVKEFADANPEALKRFIKAIDRATIFLNENKGESQEITARRLGLEKEDVALYWDNFNFDISMDQSWLINIESEARWAIESELTNATDIPNYLDYVYFDALNGVKPEAVTIIQ